MRHFLFQAAILHSALLLNLAAAQFVPIPLTSDSFNRDVVVEKGAPAPLIPVTTASMDSGSVNTGYTWYERGYQTDWVSTGLPAAGSVIQGEDVPDHEFEFPASYTTNNAVLIDSVDQTGALDLASPSAMSAVSFLLSAGGGAVTIGCRVHHQDGSVETGPVVAPNWFNEPRLAWTANGRADVKTFTFSDINSVNPRLYARDLALTNLTSPVSRIEFSYESGVGHAAIFAASGAPDSGAPFAPLRVQGFTHDMVVESTAPHPRFLLATTATMDEGDQNRLSTWYERGYVTTAPASGLPPAGSWVTNHAGQIFSLAPSWSENNVALIDALSTRATLTPVNPAPWSALAFLTSAGRGPVTNRCVVSHEDGTAETNVIVSPYWLGQGTSVCDATGRVYVNTGVLEGVGAGGPGLFAVEFPLAQTTSPVLRIDLEYIGGADGAHAAVFAVSGGSLTATRPVLAVTGAPAGGLTISSSSPGRLESTPTLGGGAVWRDEGPIDGQRQLIPNPGEAARFYRVVAQ